MQWMVQSRKKVVFIQMRSSGQFALDHYDIKSYKEEVLKNWPYMDSDRAYDRALKQAKEEAAVYLDGFAGLKRKFVHRMGAGWRRWYRWKQKDFAVQPKRWKRMLL